MLKIIKCFFTLLFKALSEHQNGNPNIVQNAIGENINQIGIQQVNGITAEEARKISKEELDNRIATDEEVEAMLDNVWSKKVK